MTRARLDLKRPGKLLPSEHAIQAAIFDWWRAKYPDCKLLYAVPNGAHKSPAMRVKFQREGLTPGMPDINLDVPRDCFHGLRGEVKTVIGRYSEAQLIAAEQLSDAGYLVRTWRSVDTAIEDIEIYLGDWKP